MSPISIAIILVACLCLAYAAPLAEDVGAPQPMADENYRLPLIIKPNNYKISLKPYLNESDPKAFTFDGECYVTIVATVATNQIQMHLKNLKISVSEYYKETTPTIKTNLPNSVPNNLTDIVTYDLTANLEVNVPYILHFVYTGTMDDDMHGFYRSSYKDAKNKTEWLGSTQFETNHARRVFPSFDEPKFKATYDLTIVRHKSLRSVGPTRIISMTTEGDYINDVYATTPLMSSYILAFIVSKFNDNYDGEFGVLARPEYYAQTQYAFDAGTAILSELDNYLGIPYYTMGIDKMHMAAIPDFSAGAMENWGLLTYRERALLYEEGSTTLNSKQYIAAVVAHEQAHMWFGDLVTCDWWSYTWLNEGFARYFQYFGTAMYDPTFDMDKQFVVDQIQSVMSMDSTNATNSMSDENTNTPADLSRMFNSISYNKGASFIRMAKYVMGEEKFRTSLNEYLSTNSYKNAIPSDLFTIWKKYWPTDFASYADNFFSTFTTQVGYPVVTFNRTTDTTVTISQKRFLLKDNDGAEPNLLYTVPITYTTSVEKNFNDTSPKLFIQEATSAVVTIPTEASWIIGNIQETGYYRVNYDNQSWHKIHQSLNEANWNGINELNRAQFVDDLLNFARASVIDYSLAFDVLDYLKTEINYVPWTAAFNGFNYLTIRLGTETKDFANYIHYLTEKVYNSLGFEEKSTDSALEIYNRAKVLAWSCKYGNTDCIAKALSYFDSNLRTQPVPVNIRSVVYCTAMREGDEKDFNKLYNKYQTETVATEETLILNSLGCVKDSKLVSRFFDMIVSDEVRRQDKSSALSSLYSENNENVEPVFDLVEANVDKLATAMGGYSSVATVISNIASRFTTQEQLNKLKTFNTNNKDKFASSQSTLENAEKTVEENLKWSDNKLPYIKTHFAKYGKSSAAINTVSVVSMLLVALIAMLFH